MKKTIIFGLCAWFLTIGKVAADNTLSVANVSIPKGGQATIEIMCNFDEAFVGGQLNIELPKDGKVTPTMSSSKPVITLGFTGTNHSLNNSQLKDASQNLINSYRSIFVSMSNSPLPTSGVLLRIPLNVSADAVVGTVYNVKLTGIDLGTKSNQYKLVDVPFTITIANSTKRGDANGDGKITVTDIAVVVNKILQLPNNDFDLYGADANGDGEVTVTDIGVIVDMILGNNNANSRELKGLEPQ